MLERTMSSLSFRPGRSLEIQAKLQATTSSTKPVRSHQVKAKHTYIVAHKPPGPQRNHCIKSSEKLGTIAGRYQRGATSEISWAEEPCVRHRSKDKYRNPNEICEMRVIRGQEIQRGFVKSRMKQIKNELVKQRVIDFRPAKYCDQNYILAY